MHIFFLFYKVLIKISHHALVAHGVFQWEASRYAFLNQLTPPNIGAKKFLPPVMRVTVTTVSHIAE